MKRPRIYLKKARKSFCPDGKAEKTIIAAMSGQCDITPEMAMKFEHALKIPGHFWINMQRSYSEYIAREKAERKRH